MSIYSPLIHPAHRTGIVPIYETAVKEAFIRRDGSVVHMPINLVLQRASEDKRAQVLALNTCYRALRDYFITFFRALRLFVRFLSYTAIIIPVANSGMK